MIVYKEYEQTFILEEEVLEHGWIYGKVYKAFGKGPKRFMVMASPYDCYPIEDPNSIIKEIL